MTRSHGGLLKSNPDFRWYWAGLSASAIGTQTTYTVLPLLVAITLHGGSSGVSAVATATSLPYLILALFVGHFLAGRPKRRIMITADLVRAILLVVIPLAYLFDALSLPLLVVVAFLVGVATVVFEIGSFSYLPLLVADNELAAANRAMQGSITVTMIGGPALGGVLVGVLSAPFALVVDAVSYVASAFGVAAARRTEPALQKDNRPRGLTRGIRILFGNPALRSLTATNAVFNLANYAFMVNLVVWAVTVKGVTASLYGLIFAVGGAGAFLGTIIVTRLTRPMGHGGAITALIATAAPIPLLMAFLPFNGTALALALAVFEFVIAVALGASNVLSPTLRQSIVEYSDLASVEGVYRFIIYGSMPFGSAIGGILGATFGSHTGLVIAGCVHVLAIPLIIRSPIRRIRDPRDARRLTSATAKPA